MSQSEEIIELFTGIMELIVFRVDEIEFEDQHIGRNIFIVDYIGNNSPCTLKDIWDNKEFPASTTSRRVDDLVELGFVSRKRSKTDRRKIELELTEKGQALHWMFREHRIENMKSFLKSFKRSQIQTFVDILKKLVEDNQQIVVPWS